MYVLHACVWENILRVKQKRTRGKRHNWLSKSEFTASSTNDKLKDRNPELFIVSYDSQKTFHYRRFPNSLLIIIGRLTSSDLTKYKSVRLIWDGCDGQNKNSAMVAMCHAWLGQFAPVHINQVELVFPVTGHSFLTPDRVYGNIEKVVKKLEEIVKPEVVLDIISKLYSLN